jgi:16S rRNA (cytidine1402-2'-O)-methyltransferase
MQPGLYITGTPIGNLGDFSPRALETLRAADLIVAEDTRQTRKLLSHFDFHTPLQSCHKFNEASRVEAVLARIEQGAAVALTSDSGMPGISDPGSRLVAACQARGLPVTAVPGPTAVTTAVALSGWGGGGFVFVGFPPRRPGRLRRALERWVETDLPVVLYESPYRVFKLLDAAEEVFGPEQEFFLIRELTKKFEEGTLGTAEALRQAYAGREVKGECVLMVGPDRKFSAAAR